MELIGSESGVRNRTVYQTIHTDDGLTEDNGKLAGQGYTISEDFYNDYPFQFFHIKIHIFHEFLHFQNHI